MLEAVFKVGTVEQKLEELEYYTNGKKQRKKERNCKNLKKYSSTRSVAYLRWKQGLSCHNGETIKL